MRGPSNRFRFHYMTINPNVIFPLWLESWSLYSMHTACQLLVLGTMTYLIPSFILSHFDHIGLLPHLMLNSVYHRPKWRGGNFSTGHSRCTHPKTPPDMYIKARWCHFPWLNVGHILLILFTFSLTLMCCWRKHFVLRQAKDQTRES